MKKMFAVLVVLVGFLTLGSHVQAQDKPAWGTTAFFTHACQSWQRIESFEDANGDTSHFTTTEWMEDMQCIAYLSGYADGLVNTSFVVDGVVYNVFTPNGWTNKQLVQVFMAYVAAHPDTSTQPAGETLTSAMGAAGFIQKRTIGKLVPLPSKTPTNASPSNQQTAQNKM